MKKYILLAFCLLFVSATYAQSELRVYCNDGKTKTYQLSSVDSITYSQTDTLGVVQEDYVTQLIWSKSQTSKLALLKIDSVVILKDEITPGDLIDLGLSVKWASKNVGATKPEEYGGYYAWGETEEKRDYSLSTYQYYNSKTSDFINIGTNICGTTYDVARAKLGGSWRMPTHAEQEQLVSNCTCTAYTLNGVKGVRFKSNKNGNSIFLPCAGGRYGVNIASRGFVGDYWSGSLDTDDSNDAGLLYIDDYSANAGSDVTRYHGLSVRPVAP